MQETSVQLFVAAYTAKPKLERWIMMIAFISIAVHVGLFLKLITLDTYHKSLLFIYFINLLPLSCFLLSIWLDLQPQYRKHMTLSAQGVRYRGGIMQPEHEFDWEEVDVVRVLPAMVLFQLKNGEEYHVSLDELREDDTLRKMRNQLYWLTSEKDVKLV